MDYAAILAAIAEVAGPIVGQILAGADRDKVLSILQASRDEYGQIQVPKLQELAGKLAPDTQLAGIKDNPQYLQQQHEADNQLKGIADSGGLTLEDRGALNAIRNRVSRTESAGRHAIENQMAARGTLDSGAQLSMSLANQQNAAQSAAEAGEQTAGQAQRRAYEAILARSQNAGQGLDRDYRQQSNAASAQDAINRGNTDIRNVTARYNAGLPQQNFNNQLTHAGAMAGANNALTNFYSGRANNTAGTWAQGGKAAGQGIAAAGSMMMPSDEELKTRDDYDAFQQWKKSQGKA